MASVEASIVINRPIDEVFTFVADIDKLPLWSAELLETKKTSDDPVGLGTTFRAVVKLLGRRMEVSNEVTQYEPNSKFRVKVTSGPVRGEGVYSFQSVPPGTKVSVQAQIEAGGFFKLADPIVGRQLGKQYETNLANLKVLLEAPA